MRPLLSPLLVFQRLFQFQLLRLHNRLRPGRAGRRRSRTSHSLGAAITNLATALLLAVAVVFDVRSRAVSLEELTQTQGYWSFQLSGFLLATLLLTISTMKLGEDTELVWFSALPLPAKAFFPYRALSLAGARLIWATPLWAFLHGVGVARKETGEAALLALLVALALHLVNSTAATAAEFYIRSRSSRKAATRIQICCLLVGGGIAGLVFAPGMVDQWPVVKAAALRVGTIEWPATTAVRSLLAPSTARSLALMSLLALQCVGLLLLLCLIGASFLRRQGVAIPRGLKISAVGSGTDSHTDNSTF
jgi:hypothetical protein